jgi:hemerythrin-like domain-containing protein
MTANARRRLVTAAPFAALAVGVLPALAACSGPETKDVSAVEDLMREHGILRRILLVYAESTTKVRNNPAAFNASALNKAAQLFRDFGEDYHESMLEEAYIFPKVAKTGGPAASYVDILRKQHRRGRDITDYILGVTASGRVATADAEPLARAFDTFVPMYQNHAAREDTILFPAWKAALSAEEFEELGDKFEDIEKAQFGSDGFEKAVREIGAVETSLGLADLAQFTPPPLR